MARTGWRGPTAQAITSRTQTQELLRWRPMHPALIQDIEQRHYFPHIEQGHYSAA
jgi:hypothetical protein